MPQVNTEEYFVPVVLLMHLGSSAPQVHIAVFMCVTSLCVVVYSLVAVCGTPLVCVGVCGTRAFHNRQTAPFYAHTQPAAFDNAGKTRRTTQMTTPAKICAQSAMWSSY